MTTIWGLIDDRAGHASQVLGVVTKLGVPYALKRLEYNALGHLPARLLGATVRHVDAARSAPLAPPYPSLVVAAGRRTLPVLRAIKRASPTTKTIYLMWPEVTADIDLIITPEHDGVTASEQVITTLAPLHAVTTETLVAARAEWAPKLAHLPRPYVGVFLGGKTKKGDYSASEWHDVIHRAQMLAGDGTLLLTTSRRTPPEALEVARPLLRPPYLLHRWDQDKDNPYLGILALADALVVTGDSLSMCAEACMPGVPVFIYASRHVAPEKHQKLHQALYDRGVAHPLNGAARIGWKPAATLDEVGGVAAEIKRRFAAVFA